MSRASAANNASTPPSGETRRPSISMPDDLTRAARAIVADDGQPVAHGLAEHVREALEAGGEHEEVGRSHQPRRVPGHPGSLTRGPSPRSLRCRSRASRSAPSPQISTPIQELRSHSRERGKEPVESLLGAEPSEPQNEVGRPSLLHRLRRGLSLDHGIRDDTVDSPGEREESSAGRRRFAPPGPRPKGTSRPGAVPTSSPQRRRRIGPFGDDHGDL